MKLLKPPANQPKRLVFDIETSPIEAYVWDIWQQNVSLNQIIKDWTIIAWAAKWVGSSEKDVMYVDVRNQKDYRDDRAILKPLWELLDEADVLVGQNSKSFDLKKVRARMIKHDMQPFSSSKHFDTKESTKLIMSPTSTRLEYLSKTFNKKYLKLDHKDYPGQELWNECLKGNNKAWNTMQLYNIHDVLATEEYYLKIAPWDTRINLAPMTDFEFYCHCGSTEFVKNGDSYTPQGKFKRYKCAKCRSEAKKTKNVLGRKVLVGSR